VQVRTVFKVDVAQDGKSVRLYVEGLRPGYIYALDATQLRSSNDKPLLHATAYYTLNELPAGERIAASTETKASDTNERIDIRSPKRTTEIPGSWFDGPDETVTIGTLPGMQFDQKEITLKAGSKIKLIFNNPDDMMHNLLIVKNASAADAVGQAAIDLGLLGQQKGYIPESEDLLFHTNLLEPGGSDMIYFTTPNQPGDYVFVCTFPGHAALMRGILRVIPQS
jgi:azurin